MKSLRCVILAVVSSMALVGITSGLALADGLSSSPDSDSVPAGAVQVLMTVTGYDESVAAAHGYEIRHRADGTAYSVPIGTPEADASSSLIQPFSSITGNCGTSWIYIYDQTDSGHEFEVITGFGVDVAAVSYTWNVNVVGPNYNKNHSWSGGLLFRNAWQGTWTQSVSTVGTYSAKVIGGAATLSNGLVCTALNPIDNVTVY